jgi:hypothetical protein
MSHWKRDHRSARTPGRGYRDGGRDSQLCHSARCALEYVALSDTRFPELLPAGSNLCSSDDIQSCTDLRQEESPRLPIHLLDGRIRLRHVHQGLWNRGKIDFCWSKSIHSPLNVCVRHRCCCLYPRTNELLQQGPRSVLDLPVFAPATTWLIAV